MIGHEIAAFDGRFLGIDLTWRPDEPLWLGPGERDIRLDASPDSLDIESVLRRTSVAHELRHFHDFLLSPLGASVVRARFLAAMNTVRLLRILPLRAGGDMVLPVPIGRWLMMPEAEREAYVRRAAALFESTGRRLPPVLGLPHLPNATIAGEGGEKGTGEYEEREHRGSRDEVLAAVIPGIAAQLTRVDYAFGGVETAHGASYPSFPFEVSGVVAQLQHVGLCFGPAAASRAGDLLMSKDGYREVVAAVLAPAVGPSGGGAVGLSEVAMMNAYSLLGAHEPEGPYCQPLVRQAVVLDHVRKEGFTRGVGARQLFREWDEVLERRGLALGNTMDGLEASLENDAKMEAALPHMPGADVLAPLIVTLGEFISVRRRLVHQFLDDPEDYLYLGRYFRGLANRPRPPLRIAAAPRDARDCELTLRGKDGWAPWRTANERHAMVYPPHEFLPGEDAFRLDALDISTDAQAVTEMLFTDTPRATDGGIVAMTQMLGEEPTILRIVGSGSPLPLPGSLAEGLRLYSRSIRNPGDREPRDG